MTTTATGTSSNTPPSSKRVMTEDGVSSPSSLPDKKIKVEVKQEIKMEVKQEEPAEGRPKKPKGPRISEAVIRDAADKMLQVLIKNYKDEIPEVPLDVLASSITSKKGKPYKNHRSDAIQEGLRLLQTENKAKKTKGNARLLQSEIDKIPREVIAKDPAKVLEARFQQFLDRLASKSKGGSGASVTEAAERVWKKLCDGKAYSRKELVEVTSYKGTNSSGFEAIVQVLNELKFVEGKGKCAFTAKVFPHGRPR